MPNREFTKYHSTLVIKLPTVARYQMEIYLPPYSFALSMKESSTLGLAALAMVLKNKRRCSGMMMMMMIMILMLNVVRRTAPQSKSMHKPKTKNWSSWWVVGVGGSPGSWVAPGGAAGCSCACCGCGCDGRGRRQATSDFSAVCSGGRQQWALLAASGSAAT